MIYDNLAQCFTPRDRAELVGKRTQDEIRLILVPYKYHMLPNSSGEFSLVSVERKMALPDMGAVAIYETCVQGVWLVFIHKEWKFSWYSVYYARTAINAIFEGFAVVYLSSNAKDVMLGGLVNDQFTKISLDKQMTLLCGIVINYGIYVDNVSQLVTVYVSQEE